MSESRRGAAFIDMGSSLSCRTSKAANDLGIVGTYPNAVVLLVLALAAASLFTRLFWIAHPTDVVWDEQHFSRYAQAYSQGKFFFDVQPPLGHLILFFALKAAHADSGNFQFVAGLPYPGGYPYVVARLVPALAGALLPLIVFSIARTLLFSPPASFFVGMLVVLDNAMLAESHFALIDIFVPFFGFLGLLTFLCHRKNQHFSGAWWWTLCAAAVLGGLAISVKWTGASSIALMAMVALADLFRQKDGRAFATEIAMLGAIFAVTYVSVFAIHLALLPRGGIGSDFMSTEFKASLVGTPESTSRDARHIGFWQKFTQLNKNILAYNSNRIVSNPDSSHFYQWPITRKRIYLWVDRTDSQRQILLLANPVVWFFALDAMAAGVVFAFVRRKAIRKLLRQSKVWREKFFAAPFLLAVYLVNWLPFIAIKRDMYLYHYFSALLGSLLAGTFFVFELIPAVGFSGDPPDKPIRSELLYAALIFLAACGFVFNAPLSYGFRPFVGR